MRDMLKKKESDRQWRLRHKDKIKALNQKYYSQNKEKRQESNKKWADENIKRKRELSLKWYYENYDEATRSRKNYRELNAEKHKKYMSEKSKREVEKLDDRYIKALICWKSTLKRKDLSGDECRPFIEAYREYMRLKRAVRKIKG